MVTIRIDQSSDKKLFHIFVLSSSLGNSPVNMYTIVLVDIERNYTQTVYVLFIILNKQYVLVHNICLN